MADYLLLGAAGHVVNYAVMIAALRYSTTLDVSDLLAGLYIVDSENLSKYWNDRRAFEQLVLAEPRVRDPVLLHRAGGFESAIQRQGTLLDTYFGTYSPEMVNVMLTAIQKGRLRGLTEPSGKILLRPEDFLLAMANHTEVELGKKLVASGLDVERLERAVAGGEPQAGGL